MIIVTPPAGSVPEPRPQALITGDRAVVLVNDGGVTTTALVKSGVQIVTVSTNVYNELTSQLTPTTTDIDPVTGKVKLSLLPDYLQQASLKSSTQLLDGSSTLAETYVPSRLSPANLLALMSSSGGTSSSSAAITTATIGTANISTATVSGKITSNSNQVTAGLEVGGGVTLDNGAAPATPATAKAVLYTDTNSRLNIKDPAGAVRQLNGLQLVTSWPSAGMQVGDQALNATTGEHRIYKGTTLGWRLLSPHSVSSLADRNALTNLYPGYKVYCDFGTPQDHVWDGQQWRGTKHYILSGPPVRFNGGVNDSNFRRWYEYPVADPGYAYLIFGRVSMEVVQNAPKGRAEVWVSMCDTGTGANAQVFHQSYWGPSPDPNVNVWAHFDMAPMTPNGIPQSGNRTICIDWRILANNTNAFSGAYQAWVDWLLIPA